MKQKSTFFEKTKRFLAPMQESIPINFRAISMYSLWGIQPIIHIIFIQKLVAQIETKNIDVFLNIVLFYGICILFYEIGEFVLKRCGWVETVNNYRSFIHNIYMDKFISLDNNKIERLGTGRLIALIDKGMDVWALLLDRFLLEIIQLFFVLIFAFYIAFQVEALYGIFFLLIYIIISFIVIKVNDKSLYYRRKREEHWHGYIGKLVRIIMSKFEVLQTGNINKEIQSLDNSSYLLHKENQNMAPYVYVSYRIPEFFVAISQFGILFYVGMGVIRSEYSLSLFVGIFGVMTLMGAIITRSTKFFREFIKDFTKIEKLWDFFDQTPEIKGYETGNEFTYKKGEMEVKSLCYSYVKGKPVFENFSLKIDGEKITALVGNSGSGKSTLAKLLSGYIHSNNGEIIVDKQKLSKTSLKSYYKNIGYLTQDPSVFDGSILDNLTYAISSSSKSTLEKGGKDREKNLNKIIKLSKCEFIYDLPKGLDTQIGERGVKLSGGEKQRLAIAKIFLKDPKIIILDEPTSALDSFSEEQITKSMHNLFKNRTVIVIAHRLQTVKNADKIIVLESGKIAETGTHRELIKQKGIYKKMLDLQSGF